MVSFERVAFEIVTEAPQLRQDSLHMSMDESFQVRAMANSSMPHHE